MEPLDLACRLVRAGESATDAAEVAERELRALGANVERLDNALVSRFGSPRVVLAGHLDVVPPGSGFSRAFEGAVEDGWLHGRGSVDMRGACAAMIAACARLGEGKDAAIALTLDEETKMRGAAEVARSGLLAGAELVIVGEPTGMDLGVSHKGVLWFELQTRGRSAHGSQPRQGESAIANMRRLLDRLDRFPLSASDPHLGSETVSVGTIEGGDRVNMVPELCTVNVDHRFLPGTVPEQRVEELRRYLAGAGVAFTLSPVNVHEGFRAKPGPTLDRVRATLLRERPEARDVGMPFGTEAYLYQKFPATVVVCGPGEPAVMHSANERLRTEELEAATRFYGSMLAA